MRKSVMAAMPFLMWIALLCSVAVPFAAAASAKSASAQTSQSDSRGVSKGSDQQTDQKHIPQTVAGETGQRIVIDLAHGERHGSTTTQLWSIDAGAYSIQLVN